MRAVVGALVGFGMRRRFMCVVCSCCMGGIDASRFCVTFWRGKLVTTLCVTVDFGLQCTHSGPRLLKDNRLSLIMCCYEFNSLLLIFIFQLFGVWICTFLFLIDRIKLEDKSQIVWNSKLQPGTHPSLSCYNPASLRTKFPYLIHISTLKPDWLKSKLEFKASQERIQNKVETNCFISDQIRILSLFSLLSLVSSFWTRPKKMWIAQSWGLMLLLETCSISLATV